jgi:hypothetical protein
MADDLELTERLRQIDGFIRTLTSEAHILDERRHILAPIINDEGIKTALAAKLDKTRGAAGWNHLPPLLAQDLVRDLSRLFLDDGKSTASLVNLWRKLHADLRIVEHYRLSYASMLDDKQPDSIPSLPEASSAAIIARWRDEDRETNGARFDEIYARIKDGIAGFKADAVVLKLKTFRDKHHAHLEMQKLGDEPKPFEVNTLGLTFNEIFSFCDRNMAILADLGVVLTHEYWSPEQFGSVHAEQGRDLWLTLAR